MGSGGGGALEAGLGPLVLVADDDRGSVAALTEYLVAVGYRVAAAADGREAIDRARSERPDLILMDVEMPFLDGLAATRLIRSDPDVAMIPIVVITALARPDARDACLRAGASEFLAKPIRLDELGRLLESLQKGV